MGFESKLLVVVVLPRERLKFLVSSLDNSCGSYLLPFNLRFNNVK